MWDVWAVQVLGIATFPKSIHQPLMIPKTFVDVRTTGLVFSVSFTSLLLRGVVFGTAVREKIFGDT